MFLRRGIRDTIGQCLRHVAINTLPPIMIQAALVMAFAVIAEASLSFLGLGASPPTPTIGLILNAAREFLIIGAWWFALMPIAALALMLIALNFLADAILEATSPYVRNKWLKRSSRFRGWVGYFAESIPRDWARAETGADACSTADSMACCQNCATGCSCSSLNRLSRTANESEG